MGLVGLLQQLRRAVADWWRKLGRRTRFLGVRTIASRSDVPEHIGRDIILVGKEPGFKWALLECPCGCGDVIEVNLMQSRVPSWRVSLKEERATFHPSLWRPPDSCGSHFIIKDNAVLWCD